MQLGVSAGDIIHFLTGPEEVEVVFAVLAAFLAGAVPAFGDATITEQALLDQVVKGKVLQYIKFWMNVMIGEFKKFLLRRRYDTINEDLQKTIKR